MAKFKYLKKFLTTSKSGKKYTRYIYKKTGKKLHAPARKKLHSRKTRKELYGRKSPARKGMTETQKRMAEDRRREKMLKSLTGR